MKDGGKERTYGSLEEMKGKDEEERKGSMERIAKKVIGRRARIEEIRERWGKRGR